MNVDYELNLYLTLGVSKNSTARDIQKSYRNLSKTMHPDKGGSMEDFNKIVYAYEVLFDVSSRRDYDRNSVYGKNYDETLSVYDFEFNNTSLSYDKTYNEDYQRFKEQDILDIVISIDGFKDVVNYKRYVQCNQCELTGVDLSKKVECLLCHGDGEMANGKKCRLCNGEGTLSDYECDSCDGSGVDYRGAPCFMCKGVGKIGTAKCDKCNGEGRVLRSERIKLNSSQVKDGKIILKSRGHFSKKEASKSGNLVILVK